MKSSLLLDTAVPSLLAAMDALTLEPDFQIFFKKAAAAVRTLSGADGTALILLDEETQTFEYKLFEGEQQHLLNAFKGFRFSSRTGTSGRVLTSKTSIFTRNYPGAPDAMGQLVNAGLQSNLVIPLISSDKVLGVLASSWFSHTGSVANVSPQLLTLAERIASQIAVACHREKLEAQLRSLATIDPLTKLLNRRGILDCVDNNLEKLKRYNRSFALFFIDVDGLKSANDHWGHETGDILLRDVAQRLADYASLTYIKRLPLDMIKIDRSFVADLPNNKVDWDITKGIVSIAHALGLAVVAEGAEEFEQIGSLRELGCDQVQGYFIHRPMPFTEANEWLKQKTSRVAMREIHAASNASARKINAAANDEKEFAKDDVKDAKEKQRGTASVINNNYLSVAARQIQQAFDPRFSIAPRTKNRSSA